MGQKRTVVAKSNNETALILVGARKQSQGERFVSLFVRTTEMIGPRTFGIGKANLVFDSVLARDASKYKVFQGFRSPNLMTT